MEVIKRRLRVRSEVIREASEWTSRLNIKVTAILIGSYARGDFNKWSDVDIILISSEFKGNPLVRLKNIDIPPGYEVIPLTPNEFKELLRKGDILVREVVETGIVLRDDLGILKSVRKGENRD